MPLSDADSEVETPPGKVESARRTGTQGLASRVAQAHDSSGQLHREHGNRSPVRRTGSLPQQRSKEDC